MNAPTNGDQSSDSSPQQHVAAPPAVDPGDQDIDTAATDAYDEFASERGDDRQTTPDPPVTGGAGDAIDNDDTPIGLHDPSSMPRGEEDAALRERSPEFHDRPGSGKYR